MILWGAKYGADDVNRIVRGIRAQTDNPPRFVLISDRARPGLDGAVQVVDFDPFWLDEAFRGPGCQAKMVMFEPGVLPDDLPAVFVDLDTAILGDFSALVRLMRDPHDMAMFQSVVLPFGWPGRLVYRATRGRKYARGNSSIVVFHPAHSGDIAKTFRALHAQHGGLGFRPMIADERFMSWCAQDRMRAIPRHIAVKFPNDFMHKSKLWLRLKGAMPWVQARRQGLVAVTLPGPAIKAEELARLTPGDIVQDSKGRWLIWDRAVIGTMGARLNRFFADVPAP